MTSFIPENSIEATPNAISTSRFMWKTSLFPEKTKLENYVDVLAAVANPNLLRQKSNCNSTFVNKSLKNKYALDFLTELGLIKQNNIEPETGAGYCVTQRGESVLRYFKYFDSLEKEQRTRALKRQ